MPHLRSCEVSPDYDRASGNGAATQAHRSSRSVALPTFTTQQVERTPAVSGHHRKEHGSHHPPRHSHEAEDNAVINHNQLPYISETTAHTAAAPPTSGLTAHDPFGMKESSPSSGVITDTSHSNPSSHNTDDSDGAGLTNTSLATSVSAMSNKNDQRADLARSTSFRVCPISTQESTATIGKRGSLRNIRQSFRLKKNQADSTQDFGSGVLESSPSSTSGTRPDTLNDTLRSAKAVLRKKALPLSGPMRGSSFYKSNTSTSHRRLHNDSLVAVRPQTTQEQNNMSLASNNRSVQFGDGTDSQRVSPRNTSLSHGGDAFEDRPLDMRAIRPTPSTLVEMLDTSLFHDVLPNMNRSEGNVGCSLPHTTHLEESIVSGTDSEDSDADSDQMLSRHQERVNLRLQCLTQQNSRDPKQMRNDMDISPTRHSGKESASNSRSYNAFGGTGSSRSGSYLGSRDRGAKTSLHQPLHHQQLPTSSHTWHHPTFAEDADAVEQGRLDISAMDPHNHSDNVEGIFKPVSALPSKERDVWKGFGFQEECSSDDWYARMRRKLEEEGEEVGSPSPGSPEGSPSPLHQSSGKNNFEEQEYADEDAGSFPSPAAVAHKNTDRPGDARLSRGEGSEDVNVERGEERQASPFKERDVWKGFGFQEECSSDDWYARMRRKLEEEGEEGEEQKGHETAVTPSPSPPVATDVPSLPPVLPVEEVVVGAGAGTAEKSRRKNGADSSVVCWKSDIEEAASDVEGMTTTGLSWMPTSSSDPIGMMMVDGAPSSGNREARDRRHKGGGMFQQNVITSSNSPKSSMMAAFASGSVDTTVGALHHFLSSTNVQSSCDGPRESSTTRLGCFGDCGPLEPRPPSSEKPLHIHPRENILSLPSSLDIPYEA